MITRLPVEWVGSSKRDLKEFSDEVQREIGFALLDAQDGLHTDAMKTMKGFGDASVVEIIESNEGNAYRCVFTTRFDDWIYVLHSFQKKSTSGIATSQADVDMIHRRLKMAAEIHAEKLLKAKNKKKG